MEKRVIKFRAWDGNKMWMPETLTNDDSYTRLTFYNRPKTIGWGLYDDILENRVVSGEYHTIMQFTGLLDKNGNEIYEGDILEADLTDGKIRGKVFFDNGMFMVSEVGLSIFQFTTQGRMEVLGNIYEHPHLLTPTASTNQ